MKVNKQLLYSKGLNFPPVPHLIKSQYFSSHFVSKYKMRYFVGLYLTAIQGIHKSIIVPDP
jgi:hypothetical protein